MTYAALIAARPTGITLAGTTFQHALAPTHLFVTQHELSVDRPEVYAGAFERRYRARRTGRTADANLFFTGYGNLLTRLYGFVVTSPGCDATAAGAAREDIELLAQFLKGDTKTSPYSDAFPYPVLKIGHGVGDGYPHWLAGCYVYEADSLQYEEEVYCEQEHVAFALTVRKVPAAANIVMT